MSIEKTTLHPENSPDIDLYPKTSADQVEGLPDNGNIKNGSGHKSIQSNSDYESFTSENSLILDAVGSLIVDGRQIIHDGDNISVGSFYDYSYNFGVDNQVNSYGGVSFGGKNVVLGRYGFTSGNQNFVVGRSSTVFGQNSTCYSLGGFVIGSTCVLGVKLNSNAGQYGLLVGANLSCASAFSLVAGNLCEAPSTSSSCISLLGLGLKTYQSNSTVVGKYNSPRGDCYFSVGCGTSDSDRKNGFVVYTDGRASVATPPINSIDIVRKSDCYFTHKITVQANAEYTSNIAFSVSIKGNNTPIQMGGNVTFDNVIVRVNENGNNYIMFGTVTIGTNSLYVSGYNLSTGVYMTHYQDVYLLLDEV